MTDLVQNFARDEQQNEGCSYTEGAIASQMAPDSNEQFEILFAIEGRRQHFSLVIDRQTTIAQFLIIASKAGDIEEVVEIFLEDTEEPLNEDLILIEQLSAGFSPVHVATRGKIAVRVDYNGRDIEKEFRPSTTVMHLIKWAIGQSGFKLEGEPSDFELKHGTDILPPDLHIGQITHGKKTLKLVLVFKVKPQG